MISTEIKLILNQILRTFKSGFSFKNECESLLEIDFATSHERLSLMRLCFTPLLQWSQLIIVLIFLLNPFRYDLPLNQWIEQHQLMDYFFSPNPQTLILFSAVFFIVSWILRSEFLLISVISLLVSTASLHLIIALIVLSVAKLAVPFFQLMWIRKIKSKAKKIWTWYVVLKVLSRLLSAIFISKLYFFLNMNGYFSQSMSGNRMEFLFLSLFIYTLTEIIILAFWGHFFSRRQKDVRQIQILYSTVAIFNQLKLSLKFRVQLIDQVKAKLLQQENMLAQDMTGLPSGLVSQYKSEHERLKAILAQLL